ncbi:MAG: hypothetical protein IKL52_04540 [Candidatus Gastranaerophilales bacterium]|nr:hypothetical protein [Candidatus Gastranaerophilales bacterium]
MTQEYKRWYDHDPALLKLINILKDYQEELKEQAAIFLDSIEKKVSKEAIEKYYQMVKPINGGSRWYDKDPIISRTVELLRVVPQDVQKTVAQNFIETLKANGIDVE